jgi:opacity protein-like surface antigen
MSSTPAPSDDRFPHPLLIANNPSIGMEKAAQFITAFLVLLAVLFAAPPAQAQYDAGTAYLGVRGGVASTSFSGSGLDASSRSGATAGMQLGYHATEALTVEFGIQYTRRGAESMQATGGPNVSDALDYQNDRVRIDYLDFPALVKLTAPVEAVRLSAFAGPMLSFRNSGSTLNGSETQGRLQSEASVDDRFLTYDLQGVVGGEIALPIPGLSNTEVALDGRYGYGFVNVDQVQGFTLESRTLTGGLSVRTAL